MAQSTLTEKAHAMPRFTAEIVLIVISLGLAPFPAAAQQMAQAPARGYFRAEAPDSYRPAGRLGFLGVTSFQQGWFVDPDSIQLAGGRAQVWLLTVYGQVHQVAEGDTRWTWSFLDIDCTGRSWETLKYDAYDSAGKWLTGFTGPTPDPHAVATPHEEALRAHVCDGTLPEGFQIVLDQASAVAGITQAFADR